MSCGYSESVIKTGLRRGELVWQLPGVLRSYLRASVLGAAPDGSRPLGSDLTAVSHLISAVIHGLVTLRTGSIEVTSDHRLRKRAGIESHQNRLVRADIAAVRFIPCTTVKRTSCRSFSHRSGRGRGRTRRCVEDGVRIPPGSQRLCGTGCKSKGEGKRCAASVPLGSRR